MKPRTRGQSIIEFALLFPLVFFLITGLFDLGRAVFYLSTLNTAAREGTRWTIVQPKSTISTTLIQDHVREYYFSDADLAANSTITPSFNYTEPDPTITITIEYSYFPVTPGMNLLLGAGHGIPLKAESTMFLTPLAK